MKFALMSQPIDYIICLQIYQYKTYYKLTSEQLREEYFFCKNQFFPNLINTYGEELVYAGLNLLSNKVA